MCSSPRGHSQCLFGLGEGFGMVVVGVAQDGTDAFVAELEHGNDPRLLAYDLGYAVVEPIDATRDPSGTVKLRLRVRPASGDAPERPGPGRDSGLELDGSEEVERRQRVAAYALVTSELGLLATEFSDKTSVPGRWGLPGGGIEDNEQPADTVIREVCEETRQVIRLGALVEVQTSHWFGRSPRNIIEDYHAVRLVYEAVCEQPTEPVVDDVGGTTESARWIGLDQWRTLAWTAGWQQILREHIPA